MNVSQGSPSKLLQIPNPVFLLLFPSPQLCHLLIMATYNISQRMIILPLFLPSRPSSAFASILTNPLFSLMFWIFKQNPVSLKGPFCFPFCYSPNCHRYYLGEKKMKYSNWISATSTFLVQISWLCGPPLCHQRLPAGVSSYSYPLDAISS